jgi:hypothetical protein
LSLNHYQLLTAGSGAHTMSALSAKFHLSGLALAVQNLHPFTKSLSFKEQETRTCPYSTR